MTLYMVLFFSLLLYIAIIDYRSMTIPNKLIHVLGFLAAIAPIIQQNITMMDRIIGFFIISLPMLLFCIVFHNAFGGGDIKLMAVSGYILGYQDIVIAMVIGCILASVYCMYLIILKKASKGSYMCLGPFLSMGIMIGMLFGDKILIWYMC